MTVVDGEDETSLEPLKAATAKEVPSSVFADLAQGAASSEFIDTIRNATSLNFAAGKRAGSLSLKRIAAALRWADDRQGRAGTPVAFVSKGSKPLGTIPAPRSTPVVKAAVAGSATEIANPPITAALLKAVDRKICDADVTMKAHEESQAWKLGGNLMLVAVPCLEGPYNLFVEMFFTDLAGNSPRPADFPRALDEKADPFLTNVSFDLKTMVLEHFGKNRGLGDCGSLSRWVWTGERFDLLESFQQVVCAGLTSDAWPNVYTAEERR